MVAIVTSLDRRFSLVLFRLAAFLIAMVVVIFQALTGWYLGTALVGAVIVSTPLAWHIDQVYWRRERGLRFGPVGMIVALAFVWFILCGLCLVVFYVPGALWVS
jgi:hypothetical protein